MLIPTKVRENNCFKFPLVQMLIYNFLEMEAEEIAKAKAIKLMLIDK